MGLRKDLADLIKRDICEHTSNQNSRFPESFWPTAAVQITKQMSSKGYNLYLRDFFFFSPHPILLCLVKIAHFWTLMHQWQDSSSCITGGMCHVHACSLFVLLQTLLHSRTSFWNESCCLGNISKKTCYSCCLHGMVEGQNSRTASIRRETRCFVQTSPETEVTSKFASWKH